MRSMTTISGDPRAIQVFYLKAESVVAYLIEQHGEELFRRFVREYASRGGTAGASLQTVYGFDVDGLESRWASSSIGSQPSTERDVSVPLSPFIYFDTWLIGGLVLLVMGVVLVKYLVGKLRPADELEEEGLQPWEDPDLR